MQIVSYRNLNKAKLDPSRYVYSYGAVKGNVGRGQVIGHTDDIYLHNVSSNCQVKALEAIYNGASRSVAAWLIGTLPITGMTWRPDGAKLRRFSINPKLGHLEFRWSDTGAPVQFPLPAVWLRSDGCYSIG